MNVAHLPDGPPIFVAGAAHIDRRGRCAAPFRLGASNPGRMNETVGGAAFNAIRAMRSLGARVRFVSPRGGDGDALAVELALQDLDVEDIAMTWLDRRTPTYTALLDRTGDLVGGIADMELYDLMRPRVFERHSIREALAASRAVLLDANLPAETIERVVERAETKPVFAIGVSPAKVSRLLPVLPRFAAVFLSRAEAAQLVDMESGAPVESIAGRLVDAGCRAAVVTDGARPSAILEGGRVAWQRPAIVPSIRDVTGAGDTLAGVATVAASNGFPFSEAARLGMAAASLHVSEGRRDGDLTAEEIRSLAASLPEETAHYPNQRTDTA